jgi:hypothetical protein
MYRRRLLAVTGAGAASLIAGCSSAENEGADPTATATATPSATDSPTETDTPTETETPTEEPTERPDPAAFEVELSGDQTAEINEKFDVRIRITNVGGRPGTYPENLVVYSSAEDETIVNEPLDTEILPGETLDFTLDDLSHPYMDTFVFQVGDDAEWEVNIVSKTASFGEIYRSPDSIEMTVLDIEFRDSYQYEGYSGTVYEEDAPDGRKWAFVTFNAKNASGSPEFVPSKFDVVLITGNSQYEYETYYGDDEDEYEGGEVQAGIVREGFILYAVPEELSKSDIQIAWSDSYFDGDVAVRWSA